eukprot:jgi/Galph1/501/GphlegSOOS_G5229.1
MATLEFTGLPVLMKAHACLGYFGGGLCILFSAVVARYLNKPYMMYLHWALSGLGFLSLLLAYILTEVWHEGFIIMQDRHGFNGFTLVVLSFVQVVGGLIRPPKDSVKRKTWRVIHQLVAVLVISCFCFQVFTGFRRLHRMFNIHVDNMETIFESFVGIFSSCINETPVFQLIKGYIVHYLPFFIGLLCFAYCLAYWILFLIAKSFAPWTNGGMAEMSMDMPVGFFWYEPQGFSLFFKRLLINSPGRTICAAVLVFLLSASASITMLKLGKWEMKMVQENPKTPWKVVVSISHGFRQGLHYLTMLAVMTYSAILFFSILFGHAFGFFLVASLKEEESLNSQPKKQSLISWAVPVNSAGDMQAQYHTDKRNCFCDPMGCTCNPKSCNKQGGCCCEK